MAAGTAQRRAPFRDARGAQPPERRVEQLAQDHRRDLRVDALGGEKERRRQRAPQAIGRLALQ